MSALLGSSLVLAGQPGFARLQAIELRSQTFFREPPTEVRLRNGR